MKHTPLTLLTVISLALVGCGTTQAETEPAPEPTETVTATPTETPTLEASEEPTEAATDDYTGYLTQDQRDTATDEQLASYNECMSMVASDFESADMEFDGSDAHYNCIPAIEGPPEQHDDAPYADVDWEYMREVSHCYDELVKERPHILEDLPQEDIIADPTIVLEHPEVQAHCM